MDGPRNLITRALKCPEELIELSLEDWDLLVRQARSADLLGRLHIQIEDMGDPAAIPAEVYPHLEAASRLADRHAQAVRWEIECIRRALADTGLPLILLKGAAYVAADLPCGRGRFFSDVDILVPKSEINRVEQRLLTQGWMPEKLHPYDQHYYRRWMHELPPLRHRLRGTVIDVHHSILPETSRYPFDPGLLFSHAVPLAHDSRLHVLSPPDLVLHSATHLFCDGEFHHGLRDLLDMNDLLQYFGTDDGFWHSLYERAKTLGLLRPLYYAIRHCRRLFNTRFPEELVAEIEEGRPNPAAGALMDGLLERALAPAHPSCSRPSTGLALWMLYVRGHYLRMPLHLLLPHLISKALMKKDQG